MLCSKRSKQKIMKIMERIKDNYEITADFAHSSEA